jgi:hypothetical protein
MREIYISAIHFTTSSVSGGCCLHPADSISSLRALIYIVWQNDAGVAKIEEKFEEKFEENLISRRITCTK